MTTSTARRALLAIVLLGAGLRLAIWLQVRETPIPEFHRWADSDMNFFDGWARAIAGGDWLTAQPMIPYHEWHARIAESALHRPVAEQEGRALWREWLGSKRFYQDPLYPYLLAVIYRIVGSEPRVMFALQCTAGVLCIVLVYAITLRLADPCAALFAALLAALFGPAIYFEFLLLRSTFLTLLGLMTVWLAIRAVEHPSVGRFATTGLSIGCMFLLKSTGAGVLVIVTTIVALALRSDRQQLMRDLGAMLVAFTLAALPLVVRNLLVGAPPLSLASSGTPSLIRHNVQATSDEEAVRGAVQVLDAIHRGGGSAMVETLRTYSDMRSLIRHYWERFASIWLWFERPDNGNYYYYRLLLPSLSAIRVEFWIIAALAIPGLFLARSRSVPYVLLVSLIVFDVIVLVIWHHVSRFRVPTTFLLMPFAGITVVHAWRALNARQWRRAAVVIGSCSLLAVVMLRDGRRSRIRWQDYESGNELMGFIAARRGENGDRANALSLIEKHLRTEPGDLVALEPRRSTSPISVLSAREARSFAVLHELAAALAQDVDGDRASYHAFRAAVLHHVATEYANAAAKGSRR